MAHGIGRPLWVSGNFLLERVALVGGFLGSRTTLIEKNRSLEETLKDLETKLLLTSVIEQENKDLKKALGRDGQPIGILASVLSKPPQSFYDTLTLDVGSEQGVAVGDVVVISDTVVLGALDEVFDATSRARLFSSVDTETLALIDRTGVSITLIGRGAGNFEMRVPQDFDVVVGDIVVLPGMDSRIVSTVLEIESSPTNSFKRVFCKIPITISELRLVSVIEQ